MNLLGYDAWKTQSPDDGREEGPTFVKCDGCGGTGYLVPHGPVTAEYVGQEDEDAWFGDYSVTCDVCDGRGEVCDHCGGSGCRACHEEDY